MTNPTWFVMTVWADKYGGTKEQLKDWLIAHHAKEGVIGEEISPTSGKIHYQVKIHLDRGETLKGWQTLVGPFGHVDVAVEKRFTGYEEKDGNFIKWPESPLNRYKDLKLWTWQENILLKFQNQNERQILCVIDKTGNIGKTTFCKWMEANGWADVCPVLSEEYNDYTGYCIAYPHKAYIFDIPRATSLKRKNSMWSAIEKIKDGCLFERRYHPHKEWIDPPKIIVFTNDDPPEHLLSSDRWDIYSGPWTQ